MESISKKCKKIKIVLTDVDGVLTDGGMYYTKEGDIMKRFHARDGMGVTLLRKRNIPTIIITKEKTLMVKNWSSKMKIKKLLFISKDPGGVNSIIPVIKKCKKEFDKYECIIISHKLSEYRYSEENISTLGLEEFNYNSDKKKAVTNILKLYQPDIIITGSSRPYDYEPVTPEQLFVEIAKQKNIISISILDYWGKYLERFSSFDGEFNLLFVPDKICALDQLSMKSLLSLGIRKDNIKITHNPNFDKIVRETFNSKSQLISDKSEFNVLFISQPLIESKDKYNQGYSQIDMFNNFLIFLTP